MIRKLLLSVFFCLFFAASSFATVITVGSYNVTSTWTFGGSTATIRIYSNRTFVTSTGTTITQGFTTGFYKTVACTVSGTTVNCSSFTIDSTTDSSVPTAKYVADIYDSTGRSRGRYMDSFSVPTSLGTSVTWAQLRSYNAAVTILLPPAYYTSDQVNSAIAAAISTIPPGSTASLAASYGNSLATAVGTIGSSTPMILLVNQNSTCSTAITVTANIYLKFENKAKISKSTGCSITFQGLGLAAPESIIPAFSGFAAGDITWTGTTSDKVPSAISTELWDTGNVSLSDRLARADAAFTTQYIKIVCHPRTTTAGVNLSPNREIYFTQGDYPATWSGAGGHPAFGLSSNTLFHGTTAARIFEGTGIYAAAMVGPTAGDTTSSFSNIRVEDLAFEGNGTTSLADVTSSTVFIANAKNSWIRRCVFNSTHAYAAVLGGSASSGNFAENADISDNIFYKIGWQVAVVLNCKSCKISRNTFDMKGAGAVSGAGYSIIDVEPNDTTDIVENLVIENNTLDARDTTPAIFAYGMSLNGGDHHLRNITVRNNTIFAGNIVNGGVDEGRGALLEGVSAGAIEELYIYGNTIRGAGIPLDVGECRDVQIHDNDLIASGGVDPAFADIFIKAVHDGNIHDNRVVKTTAFSNLQYAGIFETERLMAVDASGSTITTHYNYAGLFGALFHEFYKGLTVTLNNTDYTLSNTFTTVNSMTTTASVGTLPQSNFAPAAVNTGTGNLNIPAHGFNTGAMATVQSSGTIFAHTLPPNFDTMTAIPVYYVIRVDANNIKLANSYANAVAAVPVPIVPSTQGTGTHTITPVMVTKFSNNQYKSNKAPDGVTLSTTGSSQIVSTAHDGEIVSVADTNYAVPKASGITAFTSLTAQRTVTLPDPTTARGKEYIVKDSSGRADEFNILLSGTIDGSSVYGIGKPYGSVRVKSNGTTWGVIAADNGGPVYALQFDSTKGHHVNVGVFYNTSGTYNNSPFVAEAWLKPLAGPTGTSGGYWMVAGYGGAHIMLVGGNASLTSADLSGNFINAGATGPNGNSYEVTADSSPPDSWAHHAVIYIPQDYFGAGLPATNTVYLYINGFLCDSFPGLVDPRTIAANENDFYIGGSDHSNWNGIISQVRLFEGGMPFQYGDTLSGFVPQRSFRGGYFLNAASGVRVPTSLLYDFRTPTGKTVPDLSVGFNGGQHTGVLAAGFSDNSVYTSVNNYETNLPKWVNAPIVRPVRSVAAPVIPPSSIIYDSFSRDDRTPAFDIVSYSGGVAHLAGPGNFEKPSNATWLDDTSSIGILAGRMATFASNPITLRAEVGQSNMDVRVSDGDVSNQPAKKFGAVYARYQDANNYIRCYPNLNVQMTCVEVVGGSILQTGTYTISNTTTTIRIAVSGTGASFYSGTGTTLAGSFTGLTGPLSTKAAIQIFGEQRIDKFEVY